MQHHSFDIQGRFLGIPYDFRRPTMPKVARRIYRPGGPMLVPKVWGAGWTLNMAHRGSWWLLGASALVAAVGAILA